MMDREYVGIRQATQKGYIECEIGPAKVLDILKQKPIRLPAWDPMFADEE